MVMMGQVLSSNLASSSESKPGKMLNVIWPYLSRKEDAESYLQCIEAWMPYLLRHWRVRKGNVNPSNFGPVKLEGK
jgi:hypothetical protein